MHFIRAIGQAQRTLHGIHIGKRKIPANPCPAMHLNCPINHFQGNVRGDYLDLGDFAFRHFITHGVHHIRRFKGQQPRHVDLHARVGNFVDIGAQARQRFAECGAAQRAFAHQLQCPLGHANRTHAVVNTSRTKATLGNFKAAPFAQQDIFVWHTHVIEQHFSVAVGRVVVAEHRQWPHDFYPRRIDGHQDHRVLLMARVLGIAQPHENHDFAARVTGTGSPPFTAIDHPFITVAHSTGSHIGGIR